MKKFTLRGVLDGFRSTVGSSSSSGSTSKADAVGAEETIWSEHFQAAKTIRHGFPFQPTALAYDPVQNLVAIGTKSGHIRIFGRPGVDCHVEHDAEFAVIQLLFLINEGALVSVCADDQLHLWSLRQKRPEIIHSLKFHRERITFCHLPFQTKWMYIGTDHGNVHIMNIETFTLSGYAIMWNKAIELLRKTHPGPVVHLSDNQNDPNKLLIGFETGLIVLWDLGEKAAEFRYNSTEGVALRSVCWHHEGKQFVSSLSDGSLNFWNVKCPQKPTSCMIPHSKLSRDGKPELCRPIMKVDLRTVRTGEPYVIFSGGMAFEKSGQTPTLTVLRGSSTTVLEMEHPVVDFIAICSTPWNNDVQDPTAIVVLLTNDFVVVDLTSPGFPCFENPYQMDLHESPVTACLYFADCPHDLIPAFYSVGCRQKKTGYSEKEWPINGGEWGSAACSYPEIIVTGHADGSVKFWDVSSVTLQVLYKLKTAKLFDTSKSRVAESNDNPFAINVMYLCVESRLLCIAGAEHVLLFRFSKQENVIDCPTLEISIVYDTCDILESPDTELTMKSRQSASQNAGSGSTGSVSSNTSNDKECQSSVKVKAGARKWSSGYQPDLCCLVAWIDGEPPSPVTSVAVNSAFGLLAFRNEYGIAVIDIVQKVCLLNIGTPDLYGSTDPYSRAPKSRSQVDGLVLSCTPDDTKSSPVVEQFSSDVSPFSDGAPAFTPSGIVSHQVPGTGDRQGDLLPLTAESVQHNVDTAGSDASQSSREQTDASSVESLDVSSTEKRKSKKWGRQSLKETMVALYQKRKSVTTPPTEACNVGDAGRSPEAARRSSAPHNSPSANRLLLPVATRHTGCPPSALKTSPVRLKPLLHACKSDGEAISPTEQLSSVNSAASCRTGGSDMVDGRVQDVPQTAPVLLHKTDKMNLIVKMNRKIRSSLRTTSKMPDRPCPVDVEDIVKFCVVNLSSEEVPVTPSVLMLTYSELLQLDRTDSSLCRSQSSSLSSLDGPVSKEAVQCLCFAETYARKSDCQVCPCLWVGTSLGSILVLAFGMPSDNARNTEPVSVVSSGTVFRLKGAIVHLSFVDLNGLLIPPVAELWKDASRTDDSTASCSRQPSAGSVKSAVSPTATSFAEIACDKQFAVICSEKQARVLSLPSQSCVSKVKITEMSTVATAAVISVKDTVCLTCYLLNGHIVIFTVPSLKPLIDVDFIPLPNVRVARTLCFSSCCNVIYFCSPSELQKLTLSAEVCDSLSEMLGDLFLPRDMPEAPKQGFFKNLFNINTAVLDREQLFGEANSGRASKAVATYTSGIGQAQESASSAMSEIGQAKRAALERGERLGELEERTAQMRSEAEEFSKSAHQLKNKYRDKKWYQF